MRAIVVHESGGPDVLKLEDVPDPVAGQGEALVKVEGAAVNHYDLGQRAMPDMTGTTVPFTPGSDAAGTRADTGERVLVTGVPGSYAELLLAPVEKMRPIPDSLDTARAAALGIAYKTAWASLRDAQLENGERLLVQAGSSGTGQAAVGIGRYLGAQVYATAGAGKAERLRDLGAEPLAYDDERLSELGANVVFDPVGGAGFERSLGALGMAGRLVTPGALDDPQVSFSLWPVIGKGLRIIGAGAHTVTTDEFDRIIELVGSGDLQGPVIDRTLPLAEAAEAHRLIEKRETFGKIVLRP